MRAAILIIDDKIKLCKSLSQNFDQLGYRSYYATNSRDALNTFIKEQINIILLDIVIGDEDGLELLLELRKINPNTPVIMITGFGTIETAVKSIKMGAFDYVQKPLVFDKLLKVVENSLRISSLSRENDNLKNRIIELSSEMITNNSKMIEMCNKAKRLAATDMPILICGDNGTGKELMADYIHINSQRSSHKMIKINCAAFPDSLLDNELFGHEKGAYTGANTDFKGVFERAHESTLLLDEIGDMSLSTQAKILRTLQNKELRRIGGNKNIEIDVRFIASTNKDLVKLIDDKLFREDLYYRLNSAIIYIPPLNQRKDDIPVLAEYFLKDFSHNNSKAIEGISDNVLVKFYDYNWPGNIREFKNTINYAAALTLKNYIDIEDLPPSFIKEDEDKDSYHIRDDLEKNLILKILRNSNYNKKKTAEILKISRKTLYNKMKKYGIDLTR